MFICGGCERQAPDEQLKYTVIHYSRVSHPNAHFFLRRFDSTDCLFQFLQRLARHADRQIVTDLTGPELVEYGPARPGELLAQLRAGATPPTGSRVAAGLR